MKEKKSRKNKIELPDFSNIPFDIQSNTIPHKAGNVTEPVYYEQNQGYAKNPYIDNIDRKFFNNDSREVKRFINLEEENSKYLDRYFQTFSNQKINANTHMEETPVDEIHEKKLYDQNKNIQSVMGRPWSILNNNTNMGKIHDRLPTIHTTNTKDVDQKFKPEDYK